MGRSARVSGARVRASRRARARTLRIKIIFVASRVDGRRWATAMGVARRRGRWAMEPVALRHVIARD